MKLSVIPAGPIQTNAYLLCAPARGEALLIDAPVAPLCRDDCAGICPVCGGDRNETPCDCVQAPRDERWAALDALRDESR